MLLSSSKRYGTKMNFANNYNVATYFYEFFISVIYLSIQLLSLTKNAIQEIQLCNNNNNNNNNNLNSKLKILKKFTINIHILNKISLGK